MAAARARTVDPVDYEDRVLDSMSVHVRAMLELKASGSVAFDYGNNLRGQVADRRGMREAFDIPGFVPDFIRPLFCRGAGPFRWVALSGDPADIAVDRPGGAWRPFRTRRPCSLDPAGAAAGQLPGPASPDLLAGIRRARRNGGAVQLAGKEGQGGGADRDRQGPSGYRFGGLAQSGDRGDARTDPTPSPTGRCSTPCSTPPAGRAGSPSTTGAAWASAIPSTPAWWRWQTAPTWRSERLQRVLTADPGTGVMRHADAGYELAIETARERGVDLPMVNRER